MGDSDHQFSPPTNASPWLRKALASSLTCDPEAVLADAQVLVRMLRGRCRRIAADQRASMKLSAAQAAGLIWREIGDIQFFGSSMSRSAIASIGRSEGWRVSVVKCRDTSRWRVMAIGRV